MKFHLFSIILSLIGFYFLADIIPVEIIFVFVGLYYWYILTLANKRYKYKWLLPPFLFSFSMLIYVYIGSLLIYSESLIYDRFSSILFSSSNMIKANFITVFAISAMWISYMSFYKSNNEVDINEKSNTTHQLKKGVSIIIVLISVLLYVYGIAYGYAGYSKNEEEVSTLERIINLFRESIFLILIIYYLNNYETVEKKRVNTYFFFLVGILVFIGILSGSKFSIVEPFLYIILINYFKNEKFSKKKLLLIFSIFILSFMIIIPLRETLNEKKEGVDVSISEIVSSIASTDDFSLHTSLTQVLYRVTYVPQLILAIEYQGQKPESVSKLWQYKLLSPINALIPRVINPNKPSITFGKWFSHNVYGSTRDNNIGATYQGILYMNGGLLSVFIGFFLVGLIQAIIVNYLFNRKYLPIYILLLLSLFLLPQEPWVFYTNIIQSLLVMLLIFNLITRKS